MINKIRIVSITFLIMGMACTRSLKEQVEPYAWKYAEGFHIRDVLYFGQNSNYTVDSVGHICNKGNIVGNIFSVNGNTLVVISIDSSKGIYKKFGNKIR